MSRWSREDCVVLKPIARPYAEALSGEMHLKVEKLKSNSSITNSTAGIKCNEGILTLINLIEQTPLYFCSSTFHP